MKILDVSGFDMRNAFDISSMFSCCKNLVNIDVSNWDVTCITRMSFLFSYCILLEELDLQKWNTKLVKEMNRMFQYNHSLKQVLVSDNWVLPEDTLESEVFAGAKIASVTVV